MFTPEHFIWIAICVVFIGALLFFSLKFKFSFKVATWIVVGISLASEVLKIFTHIKQTDNGGVLGAEFLPFHLCSLLIFVALILLFTKNEKLRGILKSFYVPVAIVGGILAIFAATSGVNFAKPFAYQCFIYHAGIIWYAVHLICTKQVDLKLKSYLRNLLILIALIFVMLWVNSALQVYNTNFFYLVKPPVKNLPILNLEHGWFAYFSVLVVGLLFAITLVHLPTLIIQIVKNKKAKQAENQTT